MSDLPFAPKAGQYSATGNVVVEQAIVDQPVDDGRRHRLGRREHHRSGVRGPRHFAGAGKQPSEHLDDAHEMGIGRSPHAARQAAAGLAKRRRCHENGVTI